MIKSSGQLSLWKHLIGLAQDEVIEALEDIELTTETRLNEFNEWMELASKGMDYWFRSTPEKIAGKNKRRSSKKKDDAFDSTSEIFTEEDKRRQNAIKNRTLKLEDIPEAGPEREEFIKKITFVSILRVRPFRRAVVWDMHYNEILPESFVMRHAMNAEASLTSGEAAFAAFASEVPEYREGIVIDNSITDLRGTYFLLDRILGVRTNAIVPIRKEGSEDDSAEKSKDSGQPRSSLVALVVVSLPFSNIFPPKFTHRLLKKFGNHPNLLLDILWENEMLNEEQLLRQESYDFRSLLDKESLVNANSILRFASTNEGAPFSGGMIISGQATGAGGATAQVKLNKAEIAVSPIHQSHFIQSELELDTYGINYSYFKLSQFHEILSIGDYRFMVMSDSGKPETTPVKVEVDKFSTEALIAIDRAVCEYKPANYEEGAYSDHMRLDIRREIFFNLLQFYSTAIFSGTSSGDVDELRKENNYFIKLDQSLKYLDAVTSSEGSFRNRGKLTNKPRDLRAIEEGLIRLGEQIYKSIKSTDIASLTLCIKHNSVLSLVLPESAQNCLPGFSLTFDGQAYDLTKELSNSKANLPPFVRDVIYELSFPENIVALSRAFNSLFNAFFSLGQPNREIKFSIDNFNLRLLPDITQLGNNLDELTLLNLLKNKLNLKGLLPSMLLPDSSILQMSIENKLVKIKIQNRDEEDTLRGELTSFWTIEKKNLPLASSMGFPEKVFRTESLEMNMDSLGNDQIILVKKSRINRGIEAEKQKIKVSGKSYLSIAELVSRIAQNRPLWFGGIDVLALIPLPDQANLSFDANTQNRRYTFYEWNNGTGNRSLFVAAFLQQPSIDELLAESPFYFYSLNDKKVSGQINWLSNEQEFPENGWLERCRRFLQIIQQNQINRQSLEEIKTLRFILDHIMHDIGSDNISESVSEMIGKLREQSETLEDTFNLDKLQTIIEAVDQLKTLYSELSKSDKPPPSLDIVWYHLRDIQEQAVRNSSDKIKIKDGKLVPKEDLQSFLSVSGKKSLSSYKKSVDLDILLSNLVRNAVVNSWRYHNKLGQSGEKSVILEFNEKKNEIIISNPASLEDLENARNRFYQKKAERYLNNSHRGLTIVRKLAEKLQIKIELKGEADNLISFHISKPKGEK